MLKLWFQSNPETEYSVLLHENENIRNKINNEICVIIDNIYAIQYIELLAIQKPVFEIENFARIDHIVIRRAVNYCLKQANFRNLIV